MIKCIGEESFNKVSITKRIQMILKSLVYLTQHFEKSNTNYYLSEGTLLGFYRDCSYIRYTSDLDIGMFIKDFQESLFEKFLGNVQLRLLLRFGNVSDGLEFRLTDDYLTYDIFFQYNYNHTHQYNAYYSDRYYKQWFPLFDLCSGDLFSYKFIVPCDPDDYLSRVYGDWRISKKKGYEWLNIDWSNGLPWSNEKIVYYKKTYLPNENPRIL